MSRLGECFERLGSEGKKALTTFITAGDPTLDATVPALHAMVEAGADILELGVPFSDPEAEGPAIQASSERGLANGVTLRSCLDMVKTFRTRDEQTPIVLMGYLNSILAMGEKAFAEAAAEAGVDGLIMVNLPPEEAADLRSELGARGMDLIFLIAPTTTDERIDLITSQASGFIYYVSLKGITGAEHLDVGAVSDRVGLIRAKVSVPVQVGFGIKDGAAAAALSGHADGVVIGSAVVRTMGANADPNERLSALRSQVSEYRTAIDGACAAAADGG
jgi:tryptophan synthase alpha chain